MEFPGQSLFQGKIILWRNITEISIRKKKFLVAPISFFNFKLKIELDLQQHTFLILVIKHNICCFILMSLIFVSCLHGKLFLISILRNDILKKVEEEIQVVTHFH